MSCTNCNKSKLGNAIATVGNIVQGYTNLVFKDAVIEKTAEERLKICNSCDDIRTLGIAKVKYCNICKCVIEAKVRANEQCPKSKW